MKGLGELNSTKGDMILSHLRAGQLALGRTALHERGTPGR